MNLPVPVYLRPLDQKDASMKVKTLSDFERTENGHEATQSSYVVLCVPALVCCRGQPVGGENGHPIGAQQADEGFSEQPGPVRGQSE